MLGLLWYLQRRVGKRMQQRRDGAEITVVARRALGGKAQLVVVETDDARYLLGVTENGVNLIERLPAERAPRPVVHLAGRAPEPMAASATPDATSRGFDALLAAEAQATPHDLAAAAAQPAVPALRRDRRAEQTSTPDPLHGSILSPQTWRQTAEFLRRAR